MPDGVVFEHELARERGIGVEPPAQTGWLGGLRDPVVGQALAALHGEPGKAWTVEGLARLVGLSRSVLAERFTGMVGHPPMQYLALWRKQFASRLRSQFGALSGLDAKPGGTTIATSSGEPCQPCSPGKLERE